MERLSRELKNELDAIPVPKDMLDATVRKALEQGRQQHWKRIGRMQKFKMSIASILVLGIITILLQAALLDSDQFQGQNYHESIIFRHGDPGLKIVAQEGKIEKHSMQQHSDGVSITLSEAYLDKGKLAVGYTVKTNRSIEGDVMVQLSAGGKNLWGGGTVWSIKPGKEKHGVFDFPKLDGVEWGDFDLHIELVEDHSTKGEWKFSFDVPEQSEYKSEKVDAKSDTGEERWYWVKNMELTPSLLKLKTTLKLSESERSVLNDSMIQGTVIYMKDGSGMVKMHRDFRSGSNQDLYEALKKGTPYTQLEVDLAPPRDVESITVVPFLQNIKNESVSVPLQEGTTLASKGAVLKLMGVAEEQGRMTIRIQKSNQLENFALHSLRVKDGNGDFHDPLSYVIKDSYLEIHYPRLGDMKELELAYQEVDLYLDDLAVEIEL